MSRQTIAVRTVLAPTEAIDAIWHAHTDVIGGPCPILLLEILSAQSALETARWRSMWNYNAGNLRGTGDGGEWMSIAGADEVIGGQIKTGPEVEAGFAAFRDRYSGAKAFVRYLGTATNPPHPNRYQGAWDAAGKGDIETYCRELQEHGPYFTASLSKYVKAMRDNLAWLRSGPMPEFLKHLAPAPRDEP